MNGPTIAYKIKNETINGNHIMGCNIIAVEAKGE